MERKRSRESSDHHHHSGSDHHHHHPDRKDQDGTRLEDYATGRLITKLYGIPLSSEDSKILEANKRL